MQIHFSSSAIYFYDSGKFFGFSISNFRRQRLAARRKIKKALRQKIRIYWRWKIPKKASWKTLQRRENFPLLDRSESR
jgi:hypothetical protein